MRGVGKGNGGVKGTCPHCKKHFKNLNLHVFRCKWLDHPPRDGHLKQEKERRRQRWKCAYQQLKDRI